MASKKKSPKVMIPGDLPETTANVESGPLISLTVPRPDSNLSQSAQVFLDSANALVVSNSESYEHAGAVLLKLNTRATEIEAMRKSLKGPIDQAARRIQELFAPPLQALDRAKQLIRGKMGQYAQEQERKRREEAAKAAEAQRKEQERLQALAKKAESKGQVEKAAELQTRAETVVAPPVLHVEAPPKVAGISMRETWSYRIEDESKLPREYLSPNLSAIAGVVRSLKQNTNIPGVVVFPELKPASGQG